MAGKLSRVSTRKIEANRKNALKSTGPKTLQGKASSGRNATKHGLFSAQMDFLSHGEDPTEYNAVLNGLRDQYQPMGTAEELEVERLAVCWWKLKRAWRYENAMNRVALRDLGRRELAEQKEWCKERDKEEEALMVELRKAAKELEDTGRVSNDLQQRIFAMDPKFESLLKAIEKTGEERLAEPTIARMCKRLGSEERSWVLALYTVTRGISVLEQLGRSRSAAVVEIAVAQHVIPHGDALDRILRYEAAIDRQLARTVDRLERLQRRRMGEMIRAPVSVHLARQ
jgi:hypothetical protein